MRGVLKGGGHRGAAPERARDRQHDQCDFPGCTAGSGDLVLAGLIRRLNGNEGMCPTFEAAAMAQWLAKA